MDAGWRSRLEAARRETITGLTDSASVGVPVSGTSTVAGSQTAPSSTAGIARPGGFGFAAYTPGDGPEPPTPWGRSAAPAVSEQTAPSSTPVSSQTTRFDAAGPGSGGQAGNYNFPGGFGLTPSFYAQLRATVAANRA